MKYGHWYMRTSSITLLFVVGIIAYWSYLAYWPIETLNVENFRITEIRPRVVDIGCIVKVEFDADKRIDRASKFAFALANGSDHTIQTGLSNHPMGFNHNAKSFLVTEETPNGVYRIRFTVLYEINGFRSITKSWLTENRITITDGKCSCDLNNNGEIDPNEVVE